MQGQSKLALPDSHPGLHVLLTASQNTFKQQTIPLLAFLGAKNTGFKRVKGTNLAPKKHVITKKLVVMTQIIVS